MKFLLGISISILLSACAITRSPMPPAPAMPAGWAESGSAGAAAMTRDWWRGFGSAELAALIDAALQANPDIRIAAERVIQAEAQVQVAGASLFPTLSFGAGTDHREARPSGGSWNGSSTSDASLSARYELDLW